MPRQPKPAKRGPGGRKALYGAPVRFRSVGLTEATWKALEREAAAREVEVGRLCRAVLMEWLDRQPERPPLFVDPISKRPVDGRAAT